MTETVRSEFVKCGRKGCKSCPHGPYVYIYFRKGGKLKKRYVGRDLSQAETVIDWGAALAAGKEVPEVELHKLIGTTPEMSFTAQRKVYRAAVRMFCKHSGNYNPLRYEQVRGAWNRLRKGRR